MGNKYYKYKSIIYYTVNGCSKYSNIFWKVNTWVNSILGILNYYYITKAITSSQPIKIIKVF